MDPDLCPLCQSPLDDAQSWCMECGAPARTRLAPTPRWRGLIAVLVVVIAISAAIITVSVAALAGG